MTSAMMRIVIPLAVIIAVVQNSSAAEDHNMPPVLRVASVQMGISGNIETNLARILRGIDEAKTAGARMVLFPETALSGFDKATIGNLDWDALEQAMVKVANAARKNEIYCLYGCATKSGKERPHNSGVLVGPDGEEVTRYHKMVPEGWFEPGNHLAYFYVDDIPCTMIVCHDNRYPELVRAPTIKGARICFYISYEVNSLETSRRKIENYRAQLIARAAENGIWVVQSNGIGSPPGQPDRVVLGYSRMVDPNGVVVVEAPEMEDTMLVHDIDPATAKRGNARKSLSIDLLQDWWQAALERVDGPADDDTSKTEEQEPAKKTARLALMQGIPEKFNLEANFKTFLEQLDEAAKQMVEIFITPECWLDGYASHADGCTVEQLRSVAQGLTTSEYLKVVSEKAREHNMYICFGFTSLEDGKLHNAAGFWNSEGNLIGVYHKTHLQNKDLKFSPGQSLPVFDTGWGPVGIVICADRRWPETIRTMRVRGAKLILLPSYGMHHEANEWWMRTRGYENQCYVAFTHPNVGFVVDPKGNIAGKREDETPGILVCDIDLTKAKDDNHIRDRRPELYQAITHLGQK